MVIFDLRPSAVDLNLELLFATKAGMKKCCLYSALQEPEAHVTAIEFPAHVQRRMPIVGIINGLVCLNLKGTDLCVWNPALNKIKHLNNDHPKAASSRVACSFSFGYEESNDDYKVVCFQNHVFDAQVSIYSLKADSWRRIDQLKGFYLADHGVFAYGKIYWSGDALGIPTSFNGKIVTLDISSDKFVEMQQPGYDAAGECIFKMEASGGRPFVLCDYYQVRNVDLWVLDKHGDEESWSKLVSIPYTAFNHKYTSSFFFRAPCISRNFEIVFGDEYDLFVYNWKKKESRKIKLDVGIASHTSDTIVHAYVESFVWPYDA